MYKFLDKFMDKLSYSFIKNILYRLPSNKINSFNNFNIQHNNKILFNNDAKYFIIKVKGKKSYLWFTYYEKSIMCILILLNGKNINDNANEFYKLNVDFDNTLCYNNVLLYGYFNYKRFNNVILNNFVIENVLNYNK